MPIKLAATEHKSFYLATTENPSQYT